MEVFYIAKSNDLLRNEQIRCPRVMLIGPNGEQLGVKDTKDALTIANYAGLDLVLISNGETPVCKIMDYNKFKYEKEKKQKEANKKQRAANMDIKEYRMTPVTDIGDFETKLRNASEYLKKGHKVKVVVRFKGRQLAHPELGREKLDKFVERVSDIAVVEQKAKFEGRNMFLMLAPKNDK